MTINVMMAAQSVVIIKNILPILSQKEMNSAEIDPGTDTVMAGVKKQEKNCSFIPAMMVETVRKITQIGRKTTKYVNKNDFLFINMYCVICNKGYFEKYFNRTIFHYLTIACRFFIGGLFFFIFIK